MSVPAHIFREYDIRGIVNQELTEEVAYLIGRAYGTFAKRRGATKVAVGRDGRVSGPLLESHLVQGIQSTGINIVRLGMLPTPALYHYTKTGGVDGGIQVTGSHNPPHYNGFKGMVGEETLHGPFIQELYQLIQKQDFEQGDGTIETVDSLPRYLDDLSSKLKLSRSVRVVVDAGNGVGGMTLVPLLRRLGCEVIELYTDVDGTFPNHPADPTVPENMKDLVKKVVETSAECGIGLDGDGDRIGVVDELGNILFGDRLLILFARQVLKENPGAPILGEVKCSHLLYKDIEKHGGVPIMWKTGHSLIKKKMKEAKVKLAGEMSGHMFFADRYYGFDDATYAAGRFLEIVTSSKIPVSQLLADLPRTVSTPEIRLDCPDDKKFKVIEKAQEYFRDKYDMIDIDGVRLTFSDGWGLVRASNTQPVLVMRFEAETEARLNEIRNLIEVPLSQWVKE
ncbi:MAG: phosphomannomutase/phosphoglucomutase [bacterium]|nr:phosphomannomutase/phosphoglucomutase [bacterium]